MAVRFVLRCLYIIMSMSSETEAEEKVEHYLKLNNKYLYEAEELIKRKDYVQASEKLWGAAAEIVKVVAAKRGIEIKSHRELYKFKNLYRTILYHYCTMIEMIRTILGEWKGRELPEVIERSVDLVDYSHIEPGKIIVITGFRRTGKTYLAYHLIKRLIPRAIPSVSYTTT